MEIILTAYSEFDTKLYLRESVGNKECIQLTINDGKGGIQKVTINKRELLKAVELLT